MIIREKGYIAMPTDFLMCEGLSLVAKGVLAMLHVLDNGNGVDTSELCEYCKDEEPTIDAAVNELQERGFLTLSEEKV